MGIPIYPCHHILERWGQTHRHLAAQIPVHLTFILSTTTLWRLEPLLRETGLPYTQIQKVIVGKNVTSLEGGTRQRNSVGLYLRVDKNIN